MKSISVIIPNYNNERFLIKCIDSVLSQTMRPKEILIVDDCSTDNSRAIILKAESENSIIRHVFLKENRGVSNARNIGIEESDAEIITFLDADDYYGNENKLENEYRILESHNFDCIAYSLIQKVDINCCSLSGRMASKRHYLEGMATKKLLSNYWNDVLMRDYLIPKKKINHVRYDVNNSLFEDYEFLIELSYIFPFYCSYQFGTSYRIKDFGLSKKPKRVLKTKREEIRKRYLRRISFYDRIYVSVFDFLNYGKSLVRKMIG